jgi:hypothetical protein
VVCIYDAIRVYVDAAYNHPQGRTADDPRVHTVAAYFGDVDDWRKLRKEWRKELTYFRVPYFHMKDFEHARNVAIFGRGHISSRSSYNGWSADTLNAFERRLHNIINRKRPDGLPRITSITSNLLINDYERTLPADLNDHPECRSPFILNVTNVMKGIAHWASSVSYYKPIHYVFAGGDNETGNLDKWFSRSFQRDEVARFYRLAKGFQRIGYDIQWMKQEPALQMVDCPAYEMNRANVEWAKNNFNPIHLDDLRKSLSSLCRIDHFGLLLREPELMEVYRDVRLDDLRLGFSKTSESSNPS